MTVKARQWLLGGLAVATLVTGFVAAGVVPVGALVEVLGSDYLAVGAVAVLAALVAVLAAGTGVRYREAEMPAVERAVTVPPAGTGFDETVSRRGLFLPLYGRADREAVRARLRTAAVETVQRADGVPRQVAVERVETGAWTDDDYAAGFLAEGRSQPLGSYARGPLRGQSRFEYGARRAARAIAREDRT